MIADIKSLKLIKHSYKSLLLGLCFFIIVWQAYSIINTLNGIQGRFKASYDANKKKLSTSFYKKDILGLREVLWSTKVAGIHSIHFISSTGGKILGDLTIGDPINPYIKTTYQLDVSYRGNEIGQISYSIDLIALNKRVVADNIFVSFLAILLAIFLITVSNYGFILRLKSVDIRLQSIGKALKNADSISEPSNLLSSLLPEQANDPIEEQFNILIQNALSITRELSETKIANAKNETMAQLTQHLSHDIRKPLSSIKLILDSFEMFKSNPSRLEKAKVDVLQSINNIQRMLNDVLNYSREVQLETSSKSLGPIIDFVIRQVTQGFPKADINFEYDFSAPNKPLIDEGRFGRVLENIIGNGIEAITIIGKKNCGIIDISTKDFTNNKNFVEITIGNDGPLFPEGVEKDLFESFFTSGKSGGTGLGLASAKKIVTLHEGEIFARNKADGNGVEFVIRLPSSNEPEDFDEDLLPKNSQEVFAPEANEDAISSLINKMKEKQDNYKIVLLDDEALYRAWVRNVIDQNPTLKSLVTLYETSTVDDALKVVVQENPEYCIVDIDLNDSKNGYDFLQAIKGMKGRQAIVHSNRTLEEDKNKATELGAVNLIPKPLPLVSLVEFLSGEKVEIKETKPVQLKEKIILACDDKSKKDNRII